MGTTAAPGGLGSHGFAAQVLERKLDEWSQRIRTDVEPGVFLTEWLNLAIHTARADSAAIWLQMQDQRWTRVALSLEAADGRAEKTVVDTPTDDVQRGFQSDAPLFLRGRRDEETCLRGLSPVRQGGTPVGVLEAVWAGDFGESAQGTLIPFLGASAELLGDFLVQHELQHLRREQSRMGIWDQFQTTVLEQPTLRELAQHLAHDGRALTGSERIAVLQVRGERCTVVAVSGVDVIDPRSTTVQVWEALGAACLELPRLSPTSPLALDDLRIAAECERVRQATGARAMMVLPLADGRGEAFGLLICEQFGEIGEVSRWEADCVRLQRVTGAPWVARCESEQGWWAGRRRHWAQAWSQRRASVVTVLLASLAVGIILWNIPVPLVITAEGQLLPAKRRHVFAGTSGIVTKVHADHGANVEVGALLAELRDPSAELESARVSGELATAQARLNVVQAARIAPATSSQEAAALAQQLAGEEAELKQRIASLLAQLKLLQDERQATQVTSPLTGEVLTWDVRAQLTGRPVQRGQILMTVGDVGGPWTVEALVRERDIGELRRGLRHYPDGVRATFMPMPAQGKVFSGRVIEVASVTEVNERGESTVRVIIAFDRPPEERLRPGTTVLPRIDCGRQELGYVWLREPWQTISRQLWLWW